MTEEHLKSGFVTIVGRPNSGKSTLVNKLVGEKICIVTDKPQTTRNVIRGIVNRPQGQVVFLDTPGLHKPVHRMNERMMNAVREAMAEVDVLALVVDVSVDFGRGDAFVIEMIAPLTIPKILLLNKIDIIRKHELLPAIERYSGLMKFDEVIPISALKGENVETFLTSLFAYLPEGPQYYPADQISDQQERTIATEIIREKLIQMTRDELPYSTAVIIDRFEEGERMHRIYATIFVEKETQKPIVIGKAGLRLKEIGTAAREDMEKFFDRKIYLELHVKVRRGWRDDDVALKSLGFAQ